MDIKFSKWSNGTRAQARIAGGSLWFGANRETHDAFIIWNGAVGWQLQTWRPRIAIWNHNLARNVLTDTQMRCLMIDPQKRVSIKDNGYSLWVGQRRIKIFADGKYAGGDWGDFLRNPIHRLWYKSRNWAPWATAAMLIPLLLVLWG